MTRLEVTGAIIVLKMEILNVLRLAEIHGLDEWWGGDASLSR